MATKRKRANENLTTLKFTVSKAAAARFLRVLEGVSAQVNTPLASSTLAEALLSEDVLKKAEEALQPKLLRLQELERERESLGIYFKD